MSFKTTPEGNMIVDYLKISDEAFHQIKNLLAQKQDKSYQGIKIGVKTRGCSGLSYLIEYADLEKNITKFDDVVIKDDVKIFIDPKVSMFLIGSEMIFEETDIKSGFDFRNPNEKGRCGCGESFKI